MRDAGLVLAKEAAQRLRICKASFVRHIAPHIPCVRVGRLKLYRLADVDAWVKNSAKGTAGTAA